MNPFIDSVNFQLLSFNTVSSFNFKTSVIFVIPAASFSTSLLSTSESIAADFFTLVSSPLKPETTCKPSFLN
ncbi:hypothetical protein OIU84_027877 [Salix udensis]|uniref:Uncharacterized protein n=1 Tax=Salix udensis TaxID=889485 RepID=A0AAD6KDJ0_9ROSI|nr:hypothetical protein OIU84_027877 [Salix udensis]